MTTNGTDTSGSILGLPEDWWKTSPDLSPVLQNLLHTEPDKMPKPMPVCGCCPGGIWYVKDGDPMVTCPPLKIYPWNPGRSFTDCQMRRRIFEAKAS